MGNTGTHQKEGDVSALVHLSATDVTLAEVDFAGGIPALAPLPKEGTDDLKEGAAKASYSFSVGDTSSDLTDLQGKAREALGNLATVCGTIADDIVHEGALRALVLLLQGDHTDRLHLPSEA
ncbi:hypothetical protein ON010_g9125 [Phytophthora cinnamomi]|nr:hypothetical protein ON010_g9125 [Phytophthora cinnamomi]